MIADDAINKVEQKDAFHGRPERFKPTWSLARHGLRLRVWRDPWIAREYRAFYEHRSIRFVVFDGANTILATGVFVEWTWGLPGSNPDDDLPDMDGFFRACGGWSHSDFTMATAIRRGWAALEPETPLHYGNVVRLDRLRIEWNAATHSAAIWQFIDDLIEREFRKAVRNRPASIIVLKAFPLECENKDDLTAEDEAAFKRRQRAMMRLYQHRLRAREFDGGEPGWMWIEVNCDQPRPVLRIVT